MQQDLTFENSNPFTIEQATHWLKISRVTKDINAFIAAKLADISADPRNQNFTRRKIYAVVSQFGTSEIRKLLPFLGDTQLVSVMEKYIAEAESDPDAKFESLPEGQQQIIIKRLEADQEIVTTKVLQEYGEKDIQEAIDEAVRIGRMSTRIADRVHQLLKNNHISS